MTLPSVEKATADLAYVEAEYPLATWVDPRTGESGFVVDVYRRRLALAKERALLIGATR